MSYRWPTYVGTFPAGSAAWHAARASGVGGSEIAPILGLSPWESPFALWNRKAGNVAQVQETTQMEWGTRLESAIVRKMLDEHPEWLGMFAELGIPAKLTPTFAHPDRPWQVANADELILAADHGGKLARRGGWGTRVQRAIETGIVPLAIGEAKGSHWGDGFGPSGDDSPTAIPVYYRCQVTWYCDVFGLDVAHLGALIGGDDYREYEIPYDAGDALVMRLAAEEFLASIAEGMPPDLDGMDSTWQAVRELHPLIEEITVEIPEDIARLYVRAVNQLKAGKAAEQHAKAVLTERMGTAKTAKFGGVKIAGRQAKGLDQLPYIVAGRILPELDDQKETATP